MKTLSTFFFAAYFCLMMIVLGGTIFSVMVEYPNWFADVPASLETTRKFYQVLHPGYFFQIFGPAMMLTGIAFVITGWRLAAARNLILLTLAIMVAIEMLTFIYIYPRLAVLFSPDVLSQPVEGVRLAAQQFTTADRIRTAMMFIASAIGVAALFRFFKQRYQDAPV